MKWIFQKDIMVRLQGDSKLPFEWEEGDVGSELS